MQVSIRIYLWVDDVSGFIFEVNKLSKAVEKDDQLFHDQILTMVG